MAFNSGSTSTRWDGNTNNGNLTIEGQHAFISHLSLFFTITYEALINSIQLKHATIYISFNSYILITHSIIKPARITWYTSAIQRTPLIGSTHAADQNSKPRSSEKQKCSPVHLLFRETVRTHDLFGAPGLRYECLNVLNIWQTITLHESHAQQYQPINAIKLKLDSKSDHQNALSEKPMRT